MYYRRGIWWILRAGPLWGQTPEQSVAASILRRYFFGLRLVIATDAGPVGHISFRKASTWHNHEACRQPLGMFQYGRDPQQEAVPHAHMPHICHSPEVRVWAMKKPKPSSWVRADVSPRQASGLNQIQEALFRSLTSNVASTSINNILLFISDWYVNAARCSFWHVSIKGWTEKVSPSYGLDGIFHTGSKAVISCRSSDG